MARRWRIRHKLMLGLATAVAILAMLLAGTLNGLWSYYVTMKSIQSKLRELDAAEELKTSIGNLTRHDYEDPVRQINHIRSHLATVTGNLDLFEQEFEATLARELTDDDGEHLKELVKGLRVRITRLDKACHLPDGLGGAMIGRDTRAVFAPVLGTIKQKLADLELTGNDLRNRVLEDLQRRIRLSRGHYQFTIGILITTSVLGLVLMVCALRFFYCWVFNPVRDLQQGVSRVAQGDFEHRIDVHSGDEMEELATAFNDMTCRLRDLYKDMARQINERSRQLVRSERLASVGFLAAGVAHEINNPLASIAFCSEALEARLTEMQTQLLVPGRGRKDFEVFAKYLKMIQDEAFRCKRITERLLEFSRGGERKRERIDLAELVQSVLDVTQHLQTSKGKEIVFNSAGPVLAWISAEEIKSVVLNLVVNALDSMDEGGRLTIRLQAKDRGAEILFADTGCGMTAEVLENVFEPFFTQNRSGKGTGLGLTITHRIVSQHGGEIEAASPGPDQGSTFRVRLPLESPEDQESGVRSQESGVRNQGSEVGEQQHDVRHRVA